MTAHNNKQTTTNNADELKVQIADVFWVFGRRGFTDTETVADSVRKIERIMKIDRNQLLREILEELPERNDLEGTEPPMPITVYARGFNNALDTITATIKSKLKEK